MVVGEQRSRGTEDGEGLKVLFTNAQSIINKMNEARAVVSMLQPDVFAITETWANDEIGTELLHIDGNLFLEPTFFGKLVPKKVD